MLVGAKLAAVASNHAGRLATTGAEAFAEAHDIPSVFDSYSDLAASEDIDICYISSLNPAHKDDAIGCLKQGKHGAIPLRWLVLVLVLMLSFWEQWSWKNPWRWAGMTRPK